MVGVEAALEIRVLHRHGKGIREIARETGSRAQHSAALSARRRGGALQASSASVDDPFKACIADRMGSATPERIPASVLLMELRERGYSGGYTMLKLFVASLRPKQGGRAGNLV